MVVEAHGRIEPPLAAPSRGVLDVRVLGPFVVVRGSTLSLPPAQRRLLAALAAFHPHPAPLSRLIELCGYPDPDGRRARRAVQTGLWRLGKIVRAGALDVDGELCQLAPDTTVDLAQFAADSERARALLDAGQAVDARDAARRALALWRGPLLVDTPLAGELPLPAGAADGMRDDVTELLAAAALEVGDADEAIAVLEPLVRRATTREGAWARLIDAYLIRGFERDAQRTAAAALNALDEVGLLPGTQLAAAAGRASAASTDRARGGPGATPRPAEASAIPAWLRPAGGMFLGRTAELERLRAGVEHAADGVGVRLLIVSGEAGAGKTRPVAELATWAADRGVAVWAGRADQDDAVPYQALAPVLRAAAQSPAVRRRDLQGPVGRLIHPDEPSEASGDPLTERQALFDAATRLLAAASSAAGSALVILEDIQWASSDLLLLVRHATRAQPMPTCVVLTIRHPGMVDPHVATLLSELASLPGSTWLGLEGLDEADLARLPAVADQASRLGCSVADVARALHSRTSGNALFVQQMGDRAEARSTCCAKASTRSASPSPATRSSKRCTSCCRRRRNDG